MQQLCQSKYEQELSEQELNFFQQRINYSNASRQSFDQTTLVPLTVINFIENLEIRQQLYDQYKTIAEQAKVDLYNLNLQTALEQRHKATLKYEDQMNKLSSDHTLVETTKLSSSMRNLIEERCKKIDERVQCIYKYKLERFLLKSNMKRHA